MDGQITNSTVSAVFDGASTMVNAGRAISETAFTAINDMRNLAQQANQQMGGYSRRDAVQTQPAPQFYQPSVYPWAVQQYAGYAYGNQNAIVGYPGITNPNYGKPGFYTGMQVVGAPMSQNIRTPQGSAWCNAWG